MGQSNTVVSAYTMYRHLQQYCSHQSIHLAVGQKSIVLRRRLLEIFRVIVSIISVSPIPEVKTKHGRHGIFSLNVKVL